MPQSIVIVGPQGCGKSLNAQALAKAFTLKRWCEADDVYPVPLRDHLILANEVTPELRAAGLKVVQFSEAIKKITPHPATPSEALMSSISEAVTAYVTTHPAGSSMAKTTLVNVLHCIGIDIEKLGPSRHDEMQAAAALRKLGWEERRASAPPHLWVWHRPVMPGEQAKSVCLSPITRSERQPPLSFTNAARDVLAERQRQISEEGWTPEHDDKKHLPGELELAAASYLCADEGSAPPAIWPWDWSWWKPKDRRRNLVKAGALILAELERIDRAAAAAKEQPRTCGD